MRIRCMFDRHFRARFADVQTYKATIWVAGRNRCIHTTQHPPGAATGPQPENVPVIWSIDGLGVLRFLNCGPITSVVSRTRVAFIVPLVCRRLRVPQRCSSVVCS